MNDMSLRSIMYAGELVTHKDDNYNKDNGQPTMHTLFFGTICQVSQETGNLVVCGSAVITQ